MQGTLCSGSLVELAAAWGRSQESQLLAATAGN